MSLSKKTLAATAAVAALALVATPSAYASKPPKPKVLAKGGLVGVLSVAYGKDRAYFTDNFGGSLYASRTGKKKTPKVLYKPKAPFAAEGVAYRKGEIVFGMDKNQGMPSAKSFLMRLTKPHKAKKVANLLAFEKAKNPDHKVTYGAQGLDQPCIDQIKAIPGAAEMGVLPYQGVVESHVYAIAATKKAYYVADAGANDILKVTKKGKVSVVAVLPAFTRTITADDVAGDPSTTDDDLPSCLVGHEFISEPVPTDVEVGPKGKLYVSTLPGGLGLGGPFGSIYTINPKTKKAKLLTTGLIAPTGLAVRADGTVYVTQLFLGKIGKIEPGSSTVKPYVDAPGAAALAWSPRGLVAALSPSVLTAEDPTAPPPAADAKVVLYKKAKVVHHKAPKVGHHKKR